MHTKLAQTQKLMHVRVCVCGDNYIVGEDYTFKDKQRTPEMYFSHHQVNLL